MKKQLIMDKALILFAENGIIDTSIQQITEQCGISKGAFYLAFQSKDELINALVDQFMTQFITDSDRIVNQVSKEELLYEFLMSSSRFREKHQAFSNVYIKEQMHKMNETMFERILYYDRLLNEVLFRLVDRLYEEKTRNEKYELIYIIKTFMQMYQIFSFQMEKEININTFVAAIIEKIEIIAQYSTKTMMTDEMRLFLDMDNVVIEKETILGKIDMVLNEVEEPIIVESLELLKGHLLDEHLAMAIVSGLIQNIQNHEASCEIAFLYKKYMEEK